jgi:hypothetical protein
LGWGAPASARVTALFDLSAPDRGPFPSDRFTVADRTQNTSLRVSLPLPDCAARPSDCEDFAIVNTLDGFNVLPRLSVPFDGAIDVDTVSSRDAFLVNLGNTLPPHHDEPRIVGINQIVWDPETRSLFVQSDGLLEQHTRYGLIVTDGIRDTRGAPVQASEAFRRFLQDPGDPRLRAYRDAVLEAIERAYVHRDHVVTASVFTTQSTTADLEKIRHQIKTATPAPADFRIGTNGERTVFSVDALLPFPNGIKWWRQIGAIPPCSMNCFSFFNVRTDAFANSPGAVGRIAYAKYRSPLYTTPSVVIPAVGTRTGVPAVQDTVDMYFTLLLPSGPMPPDGWPVAIAGHGSGDSKDGTLPFSVAAKLAEQGIATISINAVGHGSGPFGYLVVNLASGTSVTLPSGGRGIDQVGDGTIGATEGFGAPPPYTILNGRDGVRQTVVDLMQLVRVIQVGVDVDGDGTPDLDPSRIYYLGQSLGSFYGVPFLAVEPDIHVGVPTVGGDNSPASNRLTTGHCSFGHIMAARTPSLINLSGFDFDENIPLRNQPPVVNTVPGAIPIQQYLDYRGWTQQSANPTAYAPYLRRQPLAGVSAKSLIVGFARGDEMVVNPATTAMLRAGDLADRTTYFRNDLFYPTDPTHIPPDPHQSLLLLPLNPYVHPILLAYEEHVATFFASDGTVVSDPGEFFEVPIAGPLPEDLACIENVCPPPPPCP